MKLNQIEAKFLDYIDGNLPSAEMEQIKTLLEQNIAIRKSFDSYKDVMHAEKILVKAKTQRSPNLSSKILSSIEKKEGNLIKKIFSDLAFKQKFIYASIASAASIILLFKASNWSSQVGEYKDLSTKKLILEKQNITVESGPVIAKELDRQKNEHFSTKPEARTATTLSNDKGGSVDFKKQNTEITFNDERIEQSRFGAIAGAILDGVNGLAKNDSDSSPQEETKKFKALETINAPAMPAKPLAEKENFDSSYLSGNFPSEIESENLGQKADASFRSTTNYINYTENPRTQVIDQASSTFSIDVDTASYANTRRYLKSGQLPPKESIRIEEFINYFNYNYPIQYEKPFTLSYEIGPSPLEPDRFLLKLGIKARDTKDEIKPWNLVFLVDVSGSMNEQNKLPLLKQSLKLITEKMRDNDTISIVTYAGAAGVALMPSRISDKMKILSAIDNLTAGGSTNGSGGITTAYDLALQNKITSGVNRVILATDGDFNLGLTSHEDLIKLIEDKRRSGITLTGLGFGSNNLKDGTLEQLANKGNGNYFYIDSFQEARKVLDIDLLGNMEVVAKDVKLQIEFNPEQISSYRLIGYENRKLSRQDFNNDSIDAGEIGSGHTVTAIYEVILAKSELAKSIDNDFRYQKKQEINNLNIDKTFSSELAFLKIRYKEADENSSKLLRFPIEAKDLKNNIDQVTADFKFAAAVCYFGQLLRDSQFVGKYGYQDIISLAESARGDDKNGYRQEFIELNKDALALQH